MKRTGGWQDDPEITATTARADPSTRLCILLMSDAGCRLREALAFDVSSLSANNLRIFATKTRKWRSVPTTDRLRQALTDLAIGNFHTLSPRWVQRRLDDLTSAAGLPKTSPHRYRHSFATRLYLEGVPAHIIMQLLGHSKLSTTLIYIHGAENDFDLVAAALDRRARGKL